MTYRAPVEAILFTLRQAGLGLELAAAGGGPLENGPLEDDELAAILEEAGRFATQVIAPLNAPGDRQGATFRDGAVAMPAGWREAYRAWATAGWNGVSAPEEWGGQALPHTVSAACIELWNGASMAFGIGPILTAGAIEALAAHASDDLKRTYLPRLVSGEWMGTMQLTEPQAGSDLGGLRTRAEPAGDGTYRLSGQKIFITYGEHDLTDNIVHLVLARLPDAPAGSRGISLFVVPKLLVNPDGTLGARNDLRAHSIEHKLGIHASPTCTMVLGDAGGATGWLVGEEHRGLACMFTMMNMARLSVGLQGVGIAERATQQALDYARERRQGRAPDASHEEPSSIIAHPDVRRMLLTMRALTAAARSLCYATAAAIDRGTPDQAALLTPVAKAFSTDIGVEVASLGIQVHGGMGYIEETGAAQHLRDARIAPIYEGTNGIQAIDLVTRKLPRGDGAVVRGLIDAMRRTARSAAAVIVPEGSHDGLQDAVESLDRATSWLLTRLDADPKAALAGATPYLRLFGVAAGGCLVAQEAMAAQRSNDPRAPERVALARFYADNIALQALGLERVVTAGFDSMDGADAALG